MDNSIEQFIAKYPQSTGMEEMRYLRRELINYHLQNSRHNVASNPFRLHDIKFLVRNGEVYRYEQELQAYK